MHQNTAQECQSQFISKARYDVKHALQQWQPTQFSQSSWRPGQLVIINHSTCSDANTLLQLRAKPEIAYLQERETLLPG